MTDIAASDVSITINSRSTIGTSGGRKRMNDVTLIWGDGALTYPSGGVPLPTSSFPHRDFGLVDHIDTVVIAEKLVEPNYLYEYDRTNHKFVCYAGATSAGGTFDARGATAPASGTGVRVMVYGQ